MRRARLRPTTLLSLATAALAACYGGGTEPPPPPSAAGSYTLQSVQQGGVTCVVAGTTQGCFIQGTSNSRLFSGGLDLNSSLSFSMTANVTDNSGNKNLSYSGTWTQSGNNVTLRPSGSLPSVSASYNEGATSKTLTIAVPAILFDASASFLDVVSAVFRKN
jgi:hypothetical protein